MAKEKSQELTVIDFTQFSVAQLPELKGKKEEIASVIKSNPIVEIVDNSTYELAKKSRTAVKTLRTGLEKEQKDVKKRIKEHVLDVVDREYDTLVLLVKGSEQSRQEPIDAWEEKKERERQEKARLEQERIDGIKSKISDTVASWKDAFNLMSFDKIEEVLENFNEFKTSFDITVFQEFDVLFERELSSLDELLENKISTLKQQEQIRIDNLLIQERNAENNRIQEWQRTWNANIDTLSFLDIGDVKSVLVKSKLANLKHYVSGYEEIYLSTEKRLNSQIEFVSKAEEQRIAQEKLDQDKKAFEEKQIEAKSKSNFENKVNARTQQLTNLGLKFNFEDSFESTINGIYFCVAILDIKTYDDSKWDKLILKIEEVKAKEPVKEIEVIEVIEENVVELPSLEAEIQEVEFEETWSSILQDYYSESSDVSFNESEQFCNWLEENYNVPTKK